LAFAAWDAELASAIIAEHAGREGATLPILHGLQHAFGYVPSAAVPMIAAALNLTRAEIHGVVTFYHDFRSAPSGRHVLKLCRAESCQAMGADGLAGHVQAALGVGFGETTADGAVTLEQVFCLGLCSCSPAAMFDEKLIGRATPTKLDAIVARVRAA
jgi:formate dehydrogenase subunit gamma